MIETSRIETPALKRWFKDNYGIPVRARTIDCKARWAEVRIAPEPRRPGDPFNAPLRYRHRFPPELGRSCMRIVYRGHPGLEDQDWGGNITATSISMLPHQWAELLEASKLPTLARRPGDVPAAGPEE